jgi:8-oxo-dGTP diphosphatase
MSKITRRRYTYNYPRPSVTVDVVIISTEAKPRVLLIRRRDDPFARMWALPGGFVNESEKLDDAARRELFEEAGVRVNDIEQLHTFGDPGRDPRGHTISIAYWIRVDAGLLLPRAGDDAQEVMWFSLTKLPPLAFDHAKIVAMAKKRLITGRKPRPR